ncbi:MAG: hypothetical protein ACK5RF_21985, partial [Pirellula sp.]
RKVTKVSEKRTWGSREGAKTQRKKKKVGGWQSSVNSLDRYCLRRSLWGWPKSDESKRKKNLGFTRRR